MARGCLSFLLNGMMAVSSVRSTSLSGTKTSRLTEHKAVGQETSNTNGSLGMEVPLISTPQFLKPVSLDLVIPTRYTG